MISAAAFAALSCHTPHDEITPVRSQWWPTTIGPDACAKASFMMVRLAVPAAAPPARAHSRKLRRENFLAMVVYSFCRGLVIGIVQDSDAQVRSATLTPATYRNGRWSPSPS